MSDKRNPRQVAVQVARRAEARRRRALVALQTTRLDFEDGVLTHSDVHDRRHELPLTYRTGRDLRRLEAALDRVN